MFQQKCVGGLAICLWVLLLTSTALPGAHFLRAQVGSVIVRFVEVILLLFALLMEILKAVQHRVCLFLVIHTYQRKKGKKKRCLLTKGRMANKKSHVTEQAPPGLNSPCGPLLCVIPFLPPPTSCPLFICPVT